jgi:hypothetical protein
VSGGTRSDTGRDCRDAFLSLNKTCAKLRIAFWITSSQWPVLRLVVEREKGLRRGSTGHGGTTFAFAPSEAPANQAFKVTGPRTAING